MSSEKRGTIGSFALLGMTVAAVFGEKLRGAQYAPLPPEELHL